MKKKKRGRKEIHFIFWPEYMSVNAFRGDRHYHLAGLPDARTFSAGSFYLEVMRPLVDDSPVNIRLRQMLHDYLVFTYGIPRYYFSGDPEWEE